MPEILQAFDEDIESVWPWLVEDGFQALGHRLREWMRLEPSFTEPGRRDANATTRSY